MRNSEDEQFYITAEAFAAYLKEDEAEKNSMMILSRSLADAVVHLCKMSKTQAQDNAMMMGRIARTEGAVCNGDVKRIKILEDRFEKLEEYLMEFITLNKKEVA